MTQHKPPADKTEELEPRRQQLVTGEHYRLVPYREYDALIGLLKAARAWRTADALDADDPETGLADQLIEAVDRADSVAGIAQ